METNNNNTESSRLGSPYVIPGAIVIAGILIAGTIFYTSSSGTQGSKTGSTATVGNAAPSQAEEIFSEEDHSLGNPDAPVTLVEFSDFQCPFCGRFFQEVEPQIMEQYVKTGKVRFVYRDFAFLGQESRNAGQAAECAADQEKFWEYHDYLFNNQNGENQGAFSLGNLKQFAQNLGLDSEQFNSCLDSGKYAKRVSDDTAAGRRLGVSGTPSVFINERMVVGALPFEEFQTVIEEELAR